MTRKAFTLLELLVVMLIMGIMGTATVGGYLAMQRGMEQRGVMQNVNQFMRAAYQRAQIDRQPVVVYFWNETLQEEKNDKNLIVVGRAVAVRRSGRLSDVNGNYLLDEFGDLSYMRLTEDEDDEDEEEISDSGSTDEGNGMYLYCLDGQDTGFKRSIVAQTTKMITSRERMLTSGATAEFPVYAYVVMDRGGVTWQRGSSYGFEFAEIQLPHNYIFGSSFSKSETSPVTEVQVSRFNVRGISGSGAGAGSIGNNTTVQVSGLRPGTSGQLEAQKIGTSDSPDRSLRN